jgi:tRNA-guanine family transglycosylase
MFQLNKKYFDGARECNFSIHGKTLETPIPFAISNIGGGAGSIDRFVSYIDMILSQRIPILFNFYYLTRGGTFKVDWVKRIASDEDMLDFILKQREIFRKKGWIADGYKEFDFTGDKPIILLDTGSGNIVRDLAVQGLTIEGLISEFDKLIDEYFMFGESHNFDILVSLDYALKQTFRGKEKENPRYIETIEKLRKGNYNLNLLAKSLRKYSDGNFSFMLFAPVHGATVKEISRNCEAILEIEAKEGTKFGGFALALPEEGQRNYDSPEEFFYNLGRSIRSVLDRHHDNRPVHGLGIGAADNIIPLVLAGVDSYDSNTPWRRAMDGSNPSNSNFSGSYSKFLLPIVHEDGTPYPKSDDALKYVRLPGITDSFECDCAACKRYPMKTIKKLYHSIDKEEFYLAKMVMYVHAILQAKTIGSALVKHSNSIEELESFTEGLPPKYRAFVNRILLQSQLM